MKSDYSIIIFFSYRICEFPQTNDEKRKKKVVIITEKAQGEQNIKLSKLTFTMSYVGKKKMQ